MSDKTDELKILIPVLADDSEAAKGRFQKSITLLAKNMKGANAPKIEITVSKINGKKAINAFKKEIEAVIGSVGNIPANKTQKTNSNSSYGQGRFNDYYRKMEAEDVKVDARAKRRAEAEITRLSDRARRMQDISSTETKISNFEKDLGMYKQLGFDTNEASINLEKLRTAKVACDNALLSGDNATISASFKDLEAVIQSTGNSFSKVSRARSADNSINKEKDHLHNLILEMQAYEKTNDKFRSNARLSYEFDDAFGKMQTALKSGDYSAISEFDEKWKTLRGSIKSAGLEGQTFGARLKQQFEKLGVYLSASAVIMQLGKAIKNTVKTVVELDGVVTDLQIATGGTRKETQELLKTYSAMGKELGATTVDVGKAADAWLRQGYSAEQTNTLIKNSMMLSKLGQIDSADATKALTSAMKGYNVSVEDSINVVDKFTQLDMKAAVSAGYIATAMAETATGARLAGIEMDRLAGYISYVGEVTQDGAESVGTFYRTLFARMGNVKSGKLVDPETQENLSDVEAVLGGLDIKLRENGKEFRNFGQVLDEVGGKWNSFSSVEQNAIAVAFSGTRQQEKFKTLMSGYSTAMDYAAVSADSAGTALDKYENSYLKSAAAAQAEFTAQFEELSSTVWNSDLIIGSINAGTGILGFSTKAIEAFGALPSLITIAGTAMSAFGKGYFKPTAEVDSEGNFASSVVGKLEARKKALEAIKIATQEQTAALSFDVQMMTEYENGLASSVDTAELFEKTLGKASTGAQHYRLQLAEGKITSKEFEIQQKKLIATANAEAAATHGATLATKAWALAKNFGAMLLVSAAVKGIQYLVTYREEQRKTAVEAVSAYQQEADSIEVYKSKITDLRDELDAGNLSQEDAYNKRKELMQIQDDIIAKYGSEAGAINLVTGNIKNQISALEELSVAAAAKNLISQRSAIETADKKMTKESRYVLGVSIPNPANDGKLKEFVKSFEDVGITIEDDLEGQFSISITADAREAERVISDFSVKLNDFAKTAAETSAIDNIFSLSESSIKDASKTTEKYGLIYEQAKEWKVLTDENYSGMFSEAMAAKKDYDEALANDDSAGISAALEKIEEAKAQVKDAAISDVGVSEYFTEFFENLAKETALQDFEISFKADKDGLKKNIVEALASLDGLSDIDILNLEKIDGTEQQENAFASLKESAKLAGIGIDDLIGFLVRLGVVQGEVSSSTNDCEVSIAEITTKFSDAVGRVQALEDALNQLGENQSEQLSADFIVKLNELLPESAGKVSSVADAQNFLNRAILDTKTVAQSAYGAMFILYGKDVANWKKTATAKWTVDKALIGDLYALWAKYENMSAEQIDAKISFLERISGAGAELNELYAMQELHANLSKTLDSVDFSPITSPGGGAGSVSEAYKAEVDALYAAQEKLKQIQRDRNTIEQKFDLTDNLETQIRYLKQINQLYQEEQKQLHLVNNLRDAQISKNVSDLRNKGFIIDYDPDKNKLLIKNMERLGTLSGDNAKAIETLIKTTISLNDANVNASSSYMELSKSMADNSDQISELLTKSILDPYDEFISKADDFDWWNKLDQSKIEWLEKKLAAINRLREQGKITEERYKELVGESAKAIYDEKNKAINDTIDLTMELIKQEKQNLIDHLEQEKKDRADIVNLQKEALALTKEEYGYQKTLSDKIAEIAKIQNKLNELAPDDSREAIAQRKQLQEELAKLQGDLDDTQAEHIYQSQIDALDKSQEAFEKEKDSEIDTVEKTIDSTQKLYDLAIKRINSGWETLKDDLIRYNLEYGDGIRGEDSIVSAWEEAQRAAERYGDVVRALDGIKTENVPNSGGNGSVGSTPNNSPAVQEIIYGMKIRASKWYSGMSEQEQDSLAADSQGDASRLRDFGINAVRGTDGVWYLDRVGGTKLFEVYHNGGEVGVKNNEQLAKLENGEFVIPKDKTQDVFKTLDFAAFVLNKLGSTAAQVDTRSLLSSIQGNLMPALKNVPVPNQMNSNSFSPNITVKIQGPIENERAALKMGGLVAKTAMDALKDAIAQGSVNGLKSPMLST